MRVREQSLAERRELKKKGGRKEMQRLGKKTRYANEAEQKSELEKNKIKSHQTNPPLHKLSVSHR